MGELATIADRAIALLEMSADHGLVLLFVLAVLRNLYHFQLVNYYHLPYTDEI
jgi:hypothetical protein